MPITWLDLILCTVIFISGFLAMVRGFSREIITVLSWGSAVLVCFILFPLLRGVAHHIGSPGWITDIVLSGTIFLITLLITSIMLSQLVKYFLDPTIGSIDRSFGFIFGAIRGLLIVGVANLLFTSLVAERNRPSWVTEAQSDTLLNHTASAISWALLKLSVIGTRDTSDNEEFIYYRGSDRHDLSRFLQNDTEIRKE